MSKTMAAKTASTKTTGRPRGARVALATTVGAVILLVAVVAPSQPGPYGILQLRQRLEQREADFLRKQEILEGLQDEVRSLRTEVAEWQAEYERVSSGCDMPREDIANRLRMAQQLLDGCLDRFRATRRTYGGDNGRFAAIRAEHAAALEKAELFKSRYEELTGGRPGK